MENLWLPVTWTEIENSLHGLPDVEITLAKVLREELEIDSDIMPGASFKDLLVGLSLIQDARARPDNAIVWLYVERLVSGEGDESDLEELLAMGRPQAEAKDPWSPAVTEYVLEDVFDGRDFDISNIRFLNEEQIMWEYEEDVGEGSYLRENPDGLRGFFRQSTGEIFINIDRQAVHTLAHEVLHKNTSTKFEADEAYSRGLDEGITQYLARKAVSSWGLTPGTSYEDQVAVVEDLASFVGDGPIENAYFDGDVAGFRSALDSRTRPGMFDRVMQLMKAGKFVNASGALYAPEVGPVEF